VHDAIRTDIPLHCRNDPRRDTGTAELISEEATSSDPTSTYALPDQYDSHEDQKDHTGEQPSLDGKRSGSVEQGSVSTETKDVDNVLANGPLNIALTRAGARDITASLQCSVSEAIALRVSVKACLTCMRKCGHVKDSFGLARMCSDQR
jgi:hypothetical protein